MAITSVPIDVRPPAEFEYLASGVLLTSKTGTTQVSASPSELKELLNDGVTTKQGTYGTILMYASSSFIDFYVRNETKLWATGGYYSDSGGTTGRNVNILKFDENTKSYVQYSTATTLSTGEWYVLCDKLTEGKYRIQAVSNYVVFDEFYFEGLTINKSFIQHEGLYKKWIPHSPASTKGNAIPLMTSDTSPSGQAFSDSLYDASYPSYYAFDGDITKSWTSATTAFPHHIGYKFLEKKNIIKYEVQIRSLDGNDLTCAPNSWSFEGSDNGVDWRVLGQVTGQTWTSKGETKTFEVSNTNEYLMYRLNIISHNGYSSPAVSVGNLRMFESDKPSSPAHWKTVSVSLPTSNQFLSDGMSISPTLDRVVTELEPVNMTPRSDILGVNDVGKVFSTPIDLKKYFDIRRIKVEVK